MAYTDDDLQEALRQKYRNKSLDLGVDRLESMDLSRVNVPDTVEDFVGQLYRGAEGVPAIPDDVPADERASQGWRDIGMALLSDKSPAPGDDSIQESWDIMDIFPPEGMASMGAAGAKALASKGMALKGAGMMAPALAAGEIRGVIQGGLGKLEKEYKLAKSLVPGSKEFEEAQDHLADVSKALQDIGRPETQKMSQEIDHMLMKHSGAAQEAERAASRIKDREKYGIDIDSFKNRGLLRPATGKRSRQEVIEELEDALPSTYTAKNMADPQFLREEAEYWSQQATRGYPDAAETADFFQSELNRLKPPKTKGKPKPVK